VLRRTDHDQGLVGDGTSFEKKSLCSTEVQRPYIGTVEKITNCRIGVFLGYPTSCGHALVECRGSPLATGIRSCG
jgi:SRSO17 transposase